MRVESEIIAPFFSFSFSLVENRKQNCGRFMPCLITCITKSRKNNYYVGGTTTSNQQNNGAKEREDFDR